VRLVDSCITNLKAQGPSRTCNESKEEDVDLVKPSTLAIVCLFSWPKDATTAVHGYLESQNTPHTVQEYLARNKTHPPRTLPMNRVLGGA